VCWGPPSNPTIFVGFSFFVPVAGGQQGHLHVKSVFIPAGPPPELRISINIEGCGLFKVFVGFFFKRGYCFNY